MATIKDIANRLNISISTVSYALNGGPRQVPEDVKARVFAVARELNYQPNRLAKALVTGKLSIVGLVVGQGEFARRQASCVLTEAAKVGLDLLAVALPNGKAEEAAERLTDGRIDSAILVDPAPLLVDELRQRGLPVSVIYSAPMEEAIYPEPATAYAAALSHLLDLGHARVGWLGKEPRFRDAFENAATELGAEWVHVQADASLEGGYQAGKKLIAQASRPTALLAASDEMACGLMHAYREEGFEPPKEYSLIGYGDSEWGLASSPPLATIRLPLKQMALAAIKSVQREETELTFPTEFVTRGSTGRPTRVPVTLKRFDRDRLRHLG